MLIDPLNVALPVAPILLLKIVALSPVATVMAWLIEGVPVSVSSRVAELVGAVAFPKIMLPFRPSACAAADARTM